MRFGGDWRPLAHPLIPGDIIMYTYYNLLPGYNGDLPMFYSLFLRGHFLFSVLGPVGLPSNILL